MQKHLKAVITLKACKCPSASQILATISTTTSLNSADCQFYAHLYTLYTLHIYVSTHVFDRYVI